MSIFFFFFFFFPINSSSRPMKLPVTFIGSNCACHRSQQLHRAWLVNRTFLRLALFLDTASFPSLAVWKSGRGPGIFSHVSKVRIEKMVERVLPAFPYCKKRKVLSIGVLSCCSRQKSTCEKCVLLLFFHSVYLQTFME